MMTANRYSISRAIQRWAMSLQARRRRRLGERIMSELPTRMQRDIGWEPMGPMRNR